MRIKGVLGLCVLLCATPACAAPDLAVHRALYDFKLVTADSANGPNGVHGQMYYEQDDSCDAWTADRRFAIDYDYADRAGNRETSRYVAFESKDARQFSFSSEREEDGETSEKLRGTVVHHEDGSGVADYSRPDDLSFDLPQGYYLPTAFTVALIEHARAGDIFFSGTVFDGTDAEGPVLMSAVIGKPLTDGEIKILKAGNKHIDASLLTPEAWHVRLALLPLQEDDEMVPFYEIDMVLHANGVISHTFDIYPGFTIEQKLTALEKLPHKKCG